MMSSEQLAEEQTRLARETQESRDEGFNEFLDEAVNDPTGTGAQLHDYQIAVRRQEEKKLEKQFAGPDEVQEYDGVSYASAVLDGAKPVLCDHLLPETLQQKFAREAQEAKAQAEAEEKERFAKLSEELLNLPLSRPLSRPSGGVKLCGPPPPRETDDNDFDDEERERRRLKALGYSNL